MLLFAIISDTKLSRAKTIILGIITIIKKIFNFLLF